MRTDISRFLRATTQMEKRQAYALESYARVAGNKMVAYAQKNYPWDPNRTHTARDGIGSSVHWIGANRLKLSLTSQADYGIHLELVNFKHKGRLSIWEPTVKRHRTEILRGWANAVSK
jgi:hypothetical protein